MGPSYCFRRFASAIGFGRAGVMRSVPPGAPRPRGIEGLTTAVRDRGAADSGRALGDTQHNAPLPEIATRGGLQVSKYHGIWQVRVDGVFHGDYHREEHARAAAALLRIAPP